jgi:hypothetical protein
MHKAGRLALIKSVLNAISLHQIMVLAPPKKVLKQLEKIERSFFWEGRAEAHGGNCHVSWRTVCQPTTYGGLGVHDIEKKGMALRLWWLWFSRMDDNRAWQGLDLQFINEEKEFFFQSTILIHGNGQKGKFWEDRWLNGHSVREIAHQLYCMYPKATTQKRDHRGRTVRPQVGTRHTWQPRHPRDWTVPKPMEKARADHPQRPARPTHMEMDNRWHIFCKILLPRVLPE